MDPGNIVTSNYGLAVTTSTGVTAVAVGPVGGGTAHNGEVVSRLVATDRRHAEELTPMLHAALAQIGATVQDITVLVVDVGPGRFTGLRVGLATVRALAFARDLPVIGLTSLEVLAAAVVDTAGKPVTAVVDARRGEVFQQSFRVAPDLAMVGPPVVGKAEDLVSSASGIVVGDGADLYHQVYDAPAVDLAYLPGRSPDPEVMLAMAADRTAVDGTDVEPEYLRDPDVNPNIKTRPVADRNRTTESSP